MPFKEIQIFNEKNLFDHLVEGHPYLPTKPAFLLVKKGFIEVREQINIFRLTKFSIILIDNSSVYEILSYSNDLEILVITYDRAYINNLSFKFNRLNAYRIIRREFRRVYTITDGEFESVWTNLLNLNFYINENESLEYKNEIIETLFSTFIYQLGNIISHERKISKEKMTRTQEIAFAFIHLVSTNYHKEKSVEFYAKNLQLSTRHLTVVLKNALGKSASEIISEFIINDAKAQLSSTSKPINEIARELQFSDQYSFSHFFKKHENMSPSQYRNQF